MPLLNVPEAAIVALGRARGVVREEPPGSGEFRSRAMMSVSWGADHRVVDGATLAGFSNLWKSYIEEPSRMMVMLR
jgi:2-oxoisovalerate dehydrogenase E2 component (dihydrolipoyl transacylase)